MGIVVNNVSKSLGNKVAIDSVSFTAERGQVLGLLGPYGAGKSTLLKMIASQIMPDSGSITIDGTKVGSKSAKLWQTIGFLQQTNPLYNEMNVVDFLFFMAKIRQIPSYKMTASVMDMLRVCGLEEEKHKTIAELSRGYRQRVGFAQALIHNPDIMLVDEPTTGLDPNQVVEIRELIRHLGETKIVIVGSHTLSEIETTCDKVVIINQGKVVEEGTAFELRHHSGSDMIYRVMLGNVTDDVAYDSLSSLDGVNGVRIIDDGRFEIQCSASVNVAESVFNMCVDNNWYIKQFNLVETRLEDIFRNLTHTAQ